MKITNKRLLSILLCMAMVLSLLPVMALATGETPTYNLVNGVTQTITIPVGGTVNVVVDATASDIILNVNGNRMYYDWSVQAGMFPVCPNPSGFADVTLPAGSVYTVPISNASEEMEQVLEVTASAPTFGTMENPAQLVIGENEADIEADSWGYYFNWTAPEAGELTIAINAFFCYDWTYCCNVYGDTTHYGDIHYSNEEPFTPDETVSVKAGDLVEIILGTVTGAAGTVVFDVTFVPGEEDVPGGEGGSEGGEGSGEGSGEGGGEGGGEVVEGYVIDEKTMTLLSATSLEGGNMESHQVSWTAPADGILTVIMAPATPGWRYVVTFPDGSSSLGTKGTGANTEEFEVLAGGEYMVEFWSYDVAGWSESNGEISYKLTFTPKDIEHEVDISEYTISGTALVVGDNDLSMEPNTQNTLFEFAPAETGEYTFTAPVGILIGNWGTFTNPMDLSGDAKTNVVVWECSAVGQSVLIGVAGDENIILNVEKTGEVDVHQEVVYVDYVNTHTPDESNNVQLEDNQELVPVDISKPQTAVLGEDGFYHLGDANGPVLYASLINDAADMYQAYYSAYGARHLRGQLFDEEGNLVASYDFLRSLKAYVDAMDFDGFYPLTEDLEIFLKAYGGVQGWYNPMVSSFAAIQEEHDADSAWLVACYYVAEVEEDTENPENPENPSVPDGSEEEEEVVKSEYFVAGVAGLCGSEWNPGDAANQMKDKGNGISEITYKNVAAGTYEFKITKGDWTTSWGNGDANYVFTVDATSDVTIIFDSNTGNITVKQVAVSNPETGDMSIAAVALAMLTATAGAVAVIGKKKEF